MSTPPISQEIWKAQIWAVGEWGEVILKEFLNIKPGWEKREGLVEVWHHQFTTTNFIENSHCLSSLIPQIISAMGSLKV